jgi:hypothetical protein
MYLKKLSQTKNLTFMNYSLILVCKRKCITSTVIWIYLNTFMRTFMMTCRLKALQFHSLLYHGTDIKFLKTCFIFISTSSHHDSSSERLDPSVFVIYTEGNLCLLPPEKQKNLTSLFTSLRTTALKY